jgi:hypothetical protein
MDPKRDMRRFAARGPVRSFALGGLVGAAGAVATLRRLRHRSSLSGPAAGLAAFEDAPCFLELAAPRGGQPSDGAPPPDHA